MGNGLGYDRNGMRTLGFDRVFVFRTRSAIGRERPRLNLLGISPLTRSVVEGLPRRFTPHRDSRGCLVIVWTEGVQLYGIEILWRWALWPSLGRERDA